MTLWDLTLALFRRWPVLAAGALITIGCGLLSIHTQGVYMTRTQVILLAPSAWYSNKLQVSPWAVTKATGVVVKRVVGDGEVIKYASPDTTIVGISKAREGTWIRQEDDGGQWSIGYTSPVILVDTVGQTPTAALERRQAAITKIATALAEIQKDWGVAPHQRITSTVAPTSAAVQYVTGSRIRALGMTAALGIGITVGVILVLEFRARQRAGQAAVMPGEAEFVVLDAPFTRAT